MRWKGIVIISLIFIGLTACKDQQSAKELDYEQTKKMVVDILQTEDGKKVIQELITSDEMKENLVISSDIVKQSIHDALLSNRGVTMWKRLFEDPSFAKGFSESMNDSQKELQKQLMSDPEYQEQMMDIFQNPEIMNQLLQLLKSQQFRSHLQSLISESLISTLVQAEIAEILLKTKEENQQEDKSDGGKEQESDSNDEKSFNQQ